MTLNPEWLDRITRWRQELPRHFYRPLGEVTMEGFTTLAQLTPQQALAEAFAPMPTGAPWGAKWEYGWFKGDFILPAEADGKRIVLAIDVGAESIIWVNGQAAGAKDREHNEITLALAGDPGTPYSVLVESYAGHGIRQSHAGPTPLDRETVPEPPAQQVVVGISTFGIWQEEVYQLWLDVETLWQLRENLDADSLRVMEIDAGLKDFTLVTDFEQDNAMMLATIRAARARLRSLLACTNGSTAPEMFAFGHSHIDVAWLWPLQETERKAGRTLSTQLALMKLYPEFQFLQSQPHLYRMLKDRYPDIYERVKQAVADGQLIPDGATWVEPDTNISGGEALIRQFVHGKRFFKEEFGVDCELLWLPDVFGYSGALPQIMRGCGVKYFSTQKIFWAYHGTDPFPYNTFMWEGIDGSEVYVHLHNDYNARVDPNNVIGRWRERVQKDGFSTRLYPFGFGDGGGGPTRNHLEFARRLSDLEGAPRFRIAKPIEFFKDQDRRGWPDARYVGELYFQCHRGVQTSQAKTKKGNRKSEIALREAELWGTAAAVLKNHAFTSNDLDETWKAVLLNQFHDILPGSSIARVYEEAETAYAQVIAEANAVVTSATAALTTGDGDALTVFNSLSWPRKVLVSLPESFSGAAQHGNGLAVQVVDGAALVEVDVPACGWTTVKSAASINGEGGVTATPTRLENDLIAVTLNEKGEITSIVDKAAGGVELAAGVCNRMTLYKDVPTKFDAWDIDSSYEKLPVAMDSLAQIEVVTQGSLMATLRVTRMLNNSAMVQEITVRKGSRRVDFKTRIDWQERHKLLKVCFPVQVHASEALHEIQFGHIARPTHRSRPFDADRFEVANHKWTALAQGDRGFAVLNDCKYGVNVLGNEIKLTLLKSAMAPDMHADLGVQEFTYAMYAWNGSFDDSDLVMQGYDLNVPVVTTPGDAGTQSLFSLDADNIVIEAVKPAEDGSGDVVVRVYESMRKSTACLLRTTLPIAGVSVTDMLETGVKETLAAENGEIALRFRPFEVKTLRLLLA